MKHQDSQSSSTMPPFWESARSLYDEVRDRQHRSHPMTAAEAEVLHTKLDTLARSMLGVLRQSTQGIVTQTDLTVSALDITEIQETRILLVGDVRIVADHFSCAGHRALPLVLLDMNPESDEWLVVPFGGNRYAIRDLEWETNFDAPLLHVLCFWNAHWLKGAALEDSTLVDQLEAEELSHLTDLHSRAESREPWAEADLARSGPRITSVLDSRHEYVAMEFDLLDELKRFQTFRPPTAGGVFQLASSGTTVADHKRGYLLLGFDLELWLTSSLGDRISALVTATPSYSPSTPLTPVLVTASGSEYPLQEGLSVEVPLQDVDQGFSIRMGDFGNVTLLDLPA